MKVKQPCGAYIWGVFDFYAGICLSQFPPVVISCYVLGEVMPRAHRYQALCTIITLGDLILLLHPDSFNRRITYGFSIALTLFA